MENVLDKLISPQETQGCQSKNTFLSSAIPLRNRVSEKVQNQIWANEYVDFSLLLHSSISNSVDERYTLKVEANKGGTPSLVLAPNTKRQTVQSVDQWMFAFQTFVAIFSERTSQDNPALLKYGSVIRELPQSGWNWQFYDEIFRRLRQSQGAPWDQIHSELWLRSHSFRAKPTNSPRRTKHEGPISQKGIAGSSTGGFVAQDAPLSTSVSSVGSHTPLPSASNQNQKQAKGNNLLFQPPAALPTPVKVKRLAFHLEGYDAQLYQELVSDFVQGFHLHFQGTQMSQFSKTCFQQCNNQTLLTVNWLRKFVIGVFKTPSNSPHSTILRYLL